MSHTRQPSEFGGRFQIASNIELGAALQAVDDSVHALGNDVQQQIDAALRALAPTSLMFVCSLAHGQARTSFRIGNGECSVLRKLTLVRIGGTTFPSSVLWQHDDIAGGPFTLDSAQSTVDLAQIQYGERNLFLTNNDAAVDCAVFAYCDRAPL